MKIQSVSVVGLGKLGLCIAACLASSGHRVLGIDKDPERIKAVNRRKAPFFEPQLEKLLDQHGGAIQATESYSVATEKSDATLIVVNTPSEKDGSFSVRQLRDASERIGEALESKPRYHLITVVSTVLPGTIRAVVKPAIEERSGKSCGTNFGLSYSPEFIALGDVIRGLTHPDFLLIGEYDSMSGDKTQEITRSICANDPKVARMSLENAELVKIALNSYVTMKISFANVLAELCELIPNGDVDTVSKALGLDHRIGGSYLKGGLAFGGPCFPRDNQAFSFVARQLGRRAKLSEIVDQVNFDQTDRWVEFVASKVVKGGKVAILGATYKPDTEVVEASPALDIANGLARKGYRISMYDPKGIANARQVLSEDVSYATTVNECLDAADACIIATPWEQFHHLTPSDFSKQMRRPLVLDCWRILDAQSFMKKDKIDYYAVGINPSSRSPEATDAQFFANPITSP